MNFINKEFEDMKKKISTLEERNSDLVKENNFLKQESSRMANKMNQLKTAFDDQDQYIRRDCLHGDTRNSRFSKRIQMKLLKLLAPLLMFLLKTATSPYPTE